MAHVALTTPTNTTELFQSWRHRVRLNQKAHYAMAHKTAQFSFWFGTTAAVFSGAVGILILLAARGEPATWLRLTTAAISILASVITTVATSAKWSEKAAQHHSAGAAYGILHRRIEEALALPPQSDEDTRALLEILRVELDALPMKAPPIPDRVWRAIPKELTPTQNRLTEVNKTPNTNRIH